MFYKCDIAPFSFLMNYAVSDITFTNRVQITQKFMSNE